MHRRSSTFVVGLAGAVTAFAVPKALTVTTVLSSGTAASLFLAGLAGTGACAVGVATGRFADAFMCLLILAAVEGPAALVAVLTYDPKQGADIGGGFLWMSALALGGYVASRYWKRSRRTAT